MIKWSLLKVVWINLNWSCLNGFDLKLVELELKLVELELKLVKQTWVKVDEAILSWSWLSDIELKLIERNRVEVGWTWFLDFSFNSFCLAKFCWQSEYVGFKGFMWVLRGLS